MRSIGTVTLALLALLAARPATALSVDEVIGKHVAARGGAAWETIRSLRITGSYAAFSESRPFTLLRERDERYRLEHVFIKEPATVGYDGTTPWRDVGQGPEEIRGLERAILLADVHFATPFFDYAAKGYGVKLLGEQEFEGVPAVAVELRRGDDYVETWYLDPRTFLEIGRVSPGMDWIGPVERRTYYDDFRPVAGVMIPFFTESQWYTRDHVMRVEKVDVNVDLDDELFRMPPPPGMGVLEPLVGSWEVTVASRNDPNGDWRESTRRSTIVALMGGGLLEERSTTPEGMEIVRTFSYDKFNKRYRVTWFDDRRKQLDVQQGDFDEAGRLVVSNVDSGTSWNGFGLTFHARVSLLDIGDGGFKIEHETSTDGGQSWFLDGKATYTPAAE